MSEAPKYPVRTLDKAIEILNLLYNSDDPRGCGITELSVKSGLNKSVVHRIMDTLVYNDLAERDPETSRYRLGWGLYTLAQKVPQQNQLYDISIRYLIELSKAVKTTVNLGILRGTNSIIVSKIEPNSKDAPMRIATQIGEPEEAYATSLGKIILADKDDSEIRELFGPKFKFRKMTPNTVTNIDQLLERIQMARDNGYAMDNEELSPGLICLSRPIRDYTGAVVAAVSVSSLGVMMTEERKNLILENLAICCSNVSKSLGYIGK